MVARKFKCRGEAISVVREFEDGVEKAVGVVACGGIEGDMGSLGDLRTVHAGPADKVDAFYRDQAHKAASAALKAHCGICPLNPDAVDPKTFVPSPEDLGN